MLNITFSNFNFILKARNYFNHKTKTCVNEDLEIKLGIK